VSDHWPQQVKTYGGRSLHSWSPRWHANQLSALEAKLLSAKRTALVVTCWCRPARPAEWSRCDTGPEPDGRNASDW
jgi:hypothetical protein